METRERHVPDNAQARRRGELRGDPHGLSLRRTSSPLMTSPRAPLLPNRDVERSAIHCHLNSAEHRCHDKKTRRERSYTHAHRLLAGRPLADRLWYGP